MSAKEWSQGPFIPVVGHYRREAAAGAETLFLVMDSGGTMYLVGFCGKWAAWSPSALLSRSMYDLGHSFHKLSFAAFRAP